MRIARKITMAASTCALAVLGVLAVRGAFVGSDRAHEMFTSRLLVAFWFVLCGLLAAGFVAFGARRRRVGMAAMHLGCVLVIGGSMWGSQAGHQMQDRLGIHKVPRAYAIIGRQEAAAGTSLYDQLLPEEVSSWLVKSGMMQPLGEQSFDLRMEQLPVEVSSALVQAGMIQPFAELPFSLSLKGFRADDPWLLLLDVFDSSIDKDPRASSQWRIDLTNRSPVQLLETGVTLQVLGVTPAIYDDREMTQPPAVELELTRGRRKQSVRIEPKQGASRVALLLTFLYDNRHDWFEHDSPAIVLARPDVPRSHYTDVSVHQGGKQVAGGTISVNHPLHYRGYHFYFTNVDADEQHVLVLAVSDSGWLAVWVGFVCIMGGAVWRFWLAPLWRAARRRAA